MEEVHRLASSLRWKLLHLTLPLEEHAPNQQPISELSSEVEVSDSTKGLIQKLSKAETQIQSLRNENNELMIKIDQRSSHILSKNTELTSTKEELRQVREEKTALQRLYESVLHDSKREDYLLTLLRNEIQILKNTLDSVVEDHHRSREEYSELCALHGESLKKIVVMSKEIEVKEDMLQVSKAYSEKIDQQLHEGERERQGLLASEALLSLRLSDQDERVAKAEKTVVFMEEQLTSYQRQLDDMRAYLSEMEIQKNTALDGMVKIQRAFDLAVTQNQQLLLEKEKEISSLHARMMEIAANLPSDQSADRATIAPAPSSHKDQASLLSSQINMPAAIIDLPSDSESTCGVCGEPPFGVMITCANCQREYHSACAKKSGRLQGERFSFILVSKLLFQAIIALLVRGAVFKQ